jgi:hypothetical protein
MKLKEFLGISEDFLPGTRDQKGYIAAINLQTGKSAADKREGGDHNSLKNKVGGGIGMYISVDGQGNMKIAIDQEADRKSLISAVSNAATANKMLKGFGGIAADLTNLGVKVTKNLSLEGLKKALGITSETEGSDGAAKAPVEQKYGGASTLNPKRKLPSYVR